MKRFVFVAGRVLLSFGLLAVLILVFRQDIPRAVAEMARLELPQFLLAVGWYAAFILVSAWRWQVLLRSQGLHFSTWYLCRVFTVGLFFCKLLPTSIGGDVMRIAYTARQGKGVEAFSATFLDRLLGFVSLMFLAVVVALCLFAARGLWRVPLVLRQDESGQPALVLRGGVMFSVLVAILALLVILTLLLFDERAHKVVGRTVGRVRLLGIGGLIERVYGTIKRFRSKLGALGLSFVSGIGVQVALSFSWYHTARALGSGVSLVYFLIFIPILNIVVNIPSIGGLGVREATFVPLFTQPWVDNALAGHVAFAVAILFLGLDLVFALVGGTLFAFMRRDVLPAARDIQDKTQEDTSVAST